MKGHERGGKKGDYEEGAEANRKRCRPREGKGKGSSIRIKKFGGKKEGMGEEKNTV